MWVGQGVSKKSSCFPVGELLHASIARSVLEESCFAFFSQVNVTSLHELECNTGDRFGGKMLWLVDAHAEMIVSPPPALLVFGDVTMLGMWSKCILEGIASCLCMVLSYKVRWFPLPCGWSAHFSCKVQLMECSSSITWVLGGVGNTPPACI